MGTFHKVKLTQGLKEKNHLTENLFLATISVSCGHILRGEDRGGGGTGVDRDNNPFSVFI